MRTSMATTVLREMVRNRYPCLMVGSQGVGKSDLARQAAEAEGMDFVVSVPAVADVTDAKGYLWVMEGRAIFVPAGELEQVLGATRPLVWLMDDLGHAPVSVQNGFMHWPLARRVGNLKLPDCVTILAATNPRGASYGVGGLTDPVKGRFVSIVKVEPHIDDFARWGFGNGVRPEVIAHLRMHPERLCCVQPTMDIVNSPNPRNWVSVSKLLDTSIPKDAYLECFTGAVGEKDAADFLLTLEIYASMVQVDAILSDPVGAPIPREDRTGELYGIACALAFRAGAKTFPAIATYLERLVGAGRGDFARLCLEDSFLKAPECKSSAATVKLFTGKLGEMLAGATNGGAK